MDLTIRRETFGQDDKSWLGSAHGTDATQTITLDLSKFTKSTHYPDGYLRSGTGVMKTGDTTDGGQPLYGPITAEEDAILAGFLYTPVPVRAADGKAGGALLEHGRVKTARLPVPVPESARATAAGRIIFA